MMIEKDRDNHLIRSLKHPLWFKLTVAAKVAVGMSLSVEAWAYMGKTIGITVGYAVGRGSELGVQTSVMVGDGATTRLNPQLISVSPVHGYTDKNSSAIVARIGSQRSSALRGGAS